MDTAGVVEMAALLEEQVDVYHALRDLSRRKEEVLRMADIEALDELLKVEQALVVRGGELEKRRLAWQEKLAAAWGLPVESLTLETVAARSDAATAERYRAANAELTAVLNELQERNARCMVIIQQALDLVKRKLENTTAGKNLVDRLV